MNVKRLLGVVAFGGLLIAGASVERAQALSLINPGVAASVQEETATGTTEIRWRRYYRRHYGYHRHYRWHRRWHRRHW